MTAYDLSIEDMKQNELISVRAANVCVGMGVLTLGQLLAAKPDELSNARNCGRRTLEELMGLQDKYRSYLKTLEKPRQGGVGESGRRSLLDDDPRLKRAVRKLSLLTPSQEYALLSKIQSRYRRLRRQARIMFGMPGSIEDTLPYIYSPLTHPLPMPSDAGVRSRLGILEFYEDVKEYFESATSDVDTSLWTPRKAALGNKLFAIKHEYPFLADNDCLLVADHEAKNGVVPYFFVLDRFLAQATDRNARICLFYLSRLVRNHKTSLNDLAGTYGLTKERIRQVLAGRIELPARIDSFLRGIGLPDVSSPDDPVWKGLRKYNIIDEPVEEMAIRIPFLAGSHIFVRLLDDSVGFMVRKTLLHNVKVQDSVRTLCRAVVKKRSKATRLDILDYITSGNRAYDENVEALCVIYASYVSRKYNIRVERNRFIHITPVKFDYSGAIEKILEANKRPMCISELNTAFDRMHPGLDMNPVKLRYYLMLSPEIVPKGKTGKYGLKSWKGIFFGTLTDYIVHLLSNSEVPLHIDDILAAVLEEFPDTNKKSVSALVTCDVRKRFVAYENGLVGLAGASYQEEYRERAHVYSFEYRFEEFVNFVLSHNRLPIENDSVKEKSLAKWKTNVLKQRLQITDAQLRALQDFIASHAGIPQNGREHHFRQGCERMKEVIRKTSRLPDASANSREYLWLRHYKKCRQDLTGNRRAYFEDLLSFARQHGLEIE